MTRSIRLVVVIGVVTLAAVVGFGLAGGASAQEDPTDANVTDVIESDSEADTLANQEEIRLESSTTLVGWEFADDQLRVAVEADRPTRVSMSDDTAGIGEAGATRVPVSTERVFDGTTVLVFPVEEFGGGHAATVGAGGESVRLSTDMDASGDDPFQYFGGESGLFSGMGLAVLTSLGGAGYVLWREDSGVIKA
ncbi:hypothetical protein J2751_000828 [Halorubrum alkaliphilum]|uniref:Uncharacterized protein n=1 Tax=Halorubrum alkaliphilum TaxID=261290 RepID=A0A8T4GEE1_9EURY|nr:hypothetical protein [Halorubrum alkaliphilum]MBP1921831.1 hypothetical protein [Halorubrum alkaliphilum]